MGAYINSRTEPQEVFLQREGTPITLEEMNSWADFSGEFLPVCLVNNGAFRAAAIGFDARETRDLTAAGDHRPRKFYKVPRGRLLEVSNLSDYLK